MRIGHARRGLFAIPWRGVALALLALLAALGLLLGGSSPVPAAAEGAQAASGLGAGMMHSLAVKEDGTLWWWGLDGYDEETGDHYPGVLTPTQVGSDSDWAAASSGPFASFTLKNDGSLWSVDFIIAADPGVPVAPVVTRVGSDSDWIAAAEGGFTSLGLKSDGSLWSIGYSFAEGIDETEPSFTAERVGDDLDWAAVTAGAWSALALKTDGTLWYVEPGFDFDAFEMFGDPAETVASFDVFPVDGDSDWAAVSAGGDHLLALKADGSLWAMGGNTYGQVGDGTTSDRYDFVQIGNQNDWAAVSAGLLHSLALKADGTLWAWGRNEDGQVGDGATLDQHSPVRVGKLGDWLAISAGYWHSCALDGDGALWAWGDNDNAQLGDGTVSDRTAPVKVLSGVRLPGPAGQGSHFTDISASPYRAAIRSLAQRGIVLGYGDGSFRPDQPVSRQQFAKMIVLGLGLKVTEGGVALAFPDVSRPSDDLYPDDYVAVASGHALVQGYPDGTFRPALDITRAQMLSIVVRAALAFKPGALRTPPPNWVGGISAGDPIHGASIAVAEYSGLALGVDPTSFSIHGKATRGEIAQVIWNLRSK